MKRRNFVKTLGLAGLSLIPSGLTKGEEHKKKPNVIFFLVDDMGWMDAGCYGSKIYNTPNIDKLASKGVRFTQAYACHPMCVASRYALMTGKYPARGGVPGGVKYQYPDSLPSSEYTIAEAFKDNGYRTFFAGKWHLHSSIYPQHQGFEVNIGGHTWGAPASYFYPYGEKDNKRKVPGLSKGKKEEYLTDRLTDETERFIRKNKDEPFLVYLSHYAVHSPLEGKETYVNKYKEIINNADFEGPAYKKEGKADLKMHQDNPDFAAMIQSVDDSLGQLMTLLEELDLTQNTIIVFTSDNGGDSCKLKRKGKSTSNYPLRTGKCWLYEGGIRVPLIASWPGTIKTGQVSEALVTGVDHYPTLLELTGQPPVPSQHLDGVSYTDTLKGSRLTPREPMYWHFPGVTKAIDMASGSIIRDGDYKLINWYKSNTYELYNLRKDIGEKHDLAKTMPEKTTELLDKLKKWRTEVNASK